MKLTIHAGLHRAASTSIEHWLIGQREAFEAAGTFVAAGSEGASTVLRGMVGQTLALAGPRAVAEAILQELTERTGTHGGGLYSDENLLGTMPRLAVPAFGAVENFAAVLGLLARHHDVVCLLILREHGAWLASLYGIAQFRGEAAGFDEFAAAVLPSPDPFRGLLRRLGDAVGGDGLKVMTLDRIAATGGRELTGLLRGRCGVEPALGPELPEANTAPPRVFCEVRHQLARLGAFLLLEDHHELRAELRALGNKPEARRPRRLERAAAMIRDLSVPLPPAGLYKTMLAEARRERELRGGGAPFLLPEQAGRALDLGLAACAGARVPQAGLDALRRHFADDRAWVAERFAPEWVGT